MRHILARLRRDASGVTAIEFAIVAPILVFMVIGVAQMGALFYGHAALRNAVSEGARYATIHPRPTAAEVVARIQANRPDSVPGTFSTPVVTYTQNAATGNWQANVTMSYTATFNFVLTQFPITFNYARQANVYAPAT
ncbi:MAG TPA: TadE/TadG family type IV pilus assembly protein [Allosphingosinicella sp.]|jgi:Flp pilus assembly protein TadG